MLRLAHVAQAQNAMDEVSRLKSDLLIVMIRLLELSPNGMHEIATAWEMAKALAAERVEAG